MTTSVVLTHAAVTLFLTGLIWTVQIVHYPLFAQVGADGFPTYQATHSTRIGALLALPWAVQGVTTAWLLVRPPAGVPPWLVGAAAVLAAVPVLVTLAVSIPAHRELGAGFDGGAHARLVATNWVRTAAWTAHAVVALVIVARALAPPLS